MKVFVYFNLHKKCWSIKALEGPRKGFVIGHASSVKLDDCTFKVSQAGRARVIREGRKNVHAGIVGRLLEWVSATPANNGKNALEAIPGGVAVTYNPYKYDSFVTVADAVRVLSAKHVILNSRSVMAYEVL